MSWSHIFGHEQQKQVFRRMIRNQTHSHAYLFFGPDGIGKETFALELARVLNCTQPSEDGSCGHCQNCTLINAQTHPDVVYLSPREGKILIEDVRDFIFYLGLKKTLGKYRIGIIRSAELFSREEVQNCLLKTIEEPPENTIIILLTSQIHMLLPTILSRCQRIQFQLLKPEDIARFLLQTYDIPEQRAQEVARQSQGRIRNAIEITEGVEPLIEKVFFLWDWVVNQREIFSLGPWFMENRDVLSQICSQFEWYLRDVFLYALNGLESVSFLNYGCYLERIRNDANRLSVEKISRIIIYTEEFERDLKRNVNLDIAAFHFVSLIREELESVPCCRN